MSRAGRAYLDHNATTPLCAAAREAMLHAFDIAGNASSVHGEGRAARAMIETARAGVAGLAGVLPEARVVLGNAGAFVRRHIP